MYVYTLYNIKKHYIVSIDVLTYIIDGLTQIKQKIHMGVSINVI